MRRSVVWLAVILVGTTAGAVAERVTERQPLALRYAPAPGRVVRTVSWTATAVTIGDVTVAGQPPAGDTLRLDAEAVQSVTERVVEARQHGWLVERVLDSTRARARAMGGAWRDVAFDTLRPTARMTISDRLQIDDFALVQPDSVSPATREWLRNPAGTFEFAFPERAVHVGEGWATELIFPMATTLDLEEVGASLPRDAQLVARVTVTLDSIVARSSDTLAYLRLQGNFVPTTLTQAAEAGAGTAAVRGGVAGNLIWSTGWDAWVSGATRAVLNVRFDAAALEEGVQAGFQMRLDASTRFQVRP